MIGREACEEIGKDRLGKEAVLRGSGVLVHGFADEREIDGCLGELLLLVAVTENQHLQEAQQVVFLILVCHSGQ